MCTTPRNTQQPSSYKDKSALEIDPNTSIFLMEPAAIINYSFHKKKTYILIFKTEHSESSYHKVLQTTHLIWDFNVYMYLWNSKLFKVHLISVGKDPYGIWYINLWDVLVVIWMRYGGGWTRDYLSCRSYIPRIFASLFACRIVSNLCFYAETVPPSNVDLSSAWVPAHNNPYFLCLITFSNL